MKVCGCDEAGRGPVIGPMVMAGVVIDDKEIARLENIGVKDSKLLSVQQRERMFDQIKRIAEAYEIVIVSPSEIDAAVLSKTTNLNWLEAGKSAEIINRLGPDSAYIDCPSNNIGKYTEYLRKLLKKDVKLVVEHKADMIYPVVSAASILAKVTRDREIEKIGRTVNSDIGSGYPSDPVTVKFLRENYTRYDFFRKSWMSYRRLADKEEQSLLKSFK